MSYSEPATPGLFAKVRRKLFDGVVKRTPLSGMRNFFGLLVAPWGSKDCGKIWAITAATAAMTILLSKSSVWLAEAYAHFFGQSVNLIKDDGVATLSSIAAAGLAWAAIVGGRALGVGTRHMLSSNLNRLASGWRVEQFNKAAFDDGHSHFALSGDKAVGLPDHLDQRIQECTRSVDGASIGLTMGALGTVSSLWFVGNALYEKSAPIEGMEFLGPFANSFVFAIAIALAYVTPNTWIASRIGRVLQRLNVERQSRDGAWRGELSQAFHRSVQIASSAGEGVQAWVNRKLYRKVNAVWFKQTVADSGFHFFNHFYNEVTSKLVPYIPYFPSAVQGRISFEDYIAGSELTRELINDMSWFIQVMPAIANIRADAQRLTEFAQARERIHDWQGFQGETGTCDFRYVTQDPAFGLRVQNLELMHKGHDAEPFMAARNLQFRPGTWTMILGENGCGKSSFMKAATGLWGYGRGEFDYPSGGVVFFAGQKPDISSQLTLRELAAYPNFAEEFSGEAVEAALKKVGLEAYLPHMDRRLHGGKTWQALLSGGQEQKLILARILLHRPDTLFLDEATSDLSPAAADAFHQTIKDECPHTIVISIVHTDRMPQFANGEAVFDQIMYVEDGEAKIYPGYKFQQISARLTARSRLSVKERSALRAGIAVSLTPIPEI